MKNYIDIEELDSVFKQYAIPYTNIFDELKQVSAKDIAKEMPVMELKDILINKEEVFAIQIWQKDDIRAALNSLGMKSDDDKVKIIMNKAKEQLENYSENWNKLHAIIKQVIFREGSIE